MTTRQDSYIKAPGPRALLVFWNSAQPISAFVSKGLEDAPVNVTWSAKGELLAFSAGDSLCIWQPTEEPGDMKLPAAHAAPPGPADKKTPPEVF
jgi:hypothetical protein